MKLYFSPGACSLHPHIALREAGLSFELVRVDTRAHKTKDGADYYAVNAKGYVPTLELDDGTRLTEGAVIDQYIADRKPESKLAPPNGTMERYRLQEWLNFIASELHKSFSPLFNPSMPDEAKAAFKERLGKRFAVAEAALESRPYLLGEHFTVADGYLFNMMRWTQFVGVDMAPFPRLQAFFQRVGERPAVKAALEAEKAAS